MNSRSAARPSTSAGWSSICRSDLAVESRFGQRVCAHAVAVAVEVDLEHRVGRISDAREVVVGVLQEALLAREIDQPLQPRFGQGPLLEVRHERSRIDREDGALRDDPAVGVHGDHGQPPEEHLGSDEASLPADAEDHLVRIDRFGRMRRGDSAGGTDAGDRNRRDGEKRGWPRQAKGSTKHGYDS